ncbi:MAG: TraR/DksA family transcriptional regulator [Methylococcaceae bacterium]|nr:TraR/DksA family transcriptional regulator [Methylococcaceae bacterium]MCI0732887.1 TraR/DksA family transcriptional regulator [Methylococcaceae bacterium]
MPSELTEIQLSELGKQLEMDFQRLREEIRQELLASDNEQYIEVAGQVHDREEESVADLLVDVNLAVIDKHIRAVEDTEAALVRLKRGEYGTCPDCGGDIPYERLKAYPVAKRCQQCQTRYEQTHARSDHHTL